MTVIVKTTVIV